MKSTGAAYSTTYSKKDLFLSSSLEATGTAASNINKFLMERRVAFQRGTAKENLRRIRQDTVERSERARAEEEVRKRESFANFEGAKLLAKSTTPSGYQTTPTHELEVGGGGGGGSVTNTTTPHNNNFKQRKMDHSTPTTTNGTLQRDNPADSAKGHVGAINLFSQCKS
jgi:hypothetical protein